MKQEILCEDCAEEMKSIIGKGHKGEYVSYQPGRAMRQFICDFCGREIAPLDRCVAFSLWSDTIPNHPNWEQNFIITKGED